MTTIRTPVRLVALWCLFGLLAAMASMSASRAPISSSVAPRAVAGKAPKSAVHAHLTPVGRSIPRAYLNAYLDAAARYRVDWKLLAAIGRNETDHGRSPLPGVHRGLNAAGVAAGPMQFCVVLSCGGTWQQYGVNGDLNPRRSIYAIGDAAFTAARYVRVLERLVGTRPRSILAAYNAGPGNVQRYHGTPPFSETRVYVERGEALMQRL